MLGSEEALPDDPLQPVASADRAAPPVTDRHSIPAIVV
jgi:hypothetical protein